MSVFGTARRKPPDPTCPAWVKVWFLEGAAPPKDSDDFHAYATVRFFSGHEAEGDLWRRWRDVLLGEWILANPGTRPAFWWYHEAPELRKVRPGQHVVTSDSRTSDGVPFVLPADEKRDGLIFEGELRVESECAYLKRLNLFFPDEAKRVKRGAFADEVVDFGDDEAA
jgi:hypothetical protein